MRCTVSLIGRGGILGGGIGTSIGQFLGQYAQDQWQMIGIMTIIGIVFGMVSNLGIHSVRPSSNKEFIMTDAELGPSKNEMIQRKRAA